jgi:glycosyltransferase involved in cell wall biosynthesis
MKILIASSTYPPDIGGPAQYARNLYVTWKNQGHEVKVAAYGWEQVLPSWIKHLVYFIKIIRKGWNAKFIFVLDNFLAAAPTMVASALLRKKYIIRTGGDLIWEWYVERTGQSILFKDFYNQPRQYSLKEKIILFFSTAAFRHASAVIFSTKWQKEIFEKAYSLDPKKNFIIENFCGPREKTHEPANRTFVAGTRTLKWKNVELLKEAFEEALGAVKAKGLAPIDLDTGKAVYDSFVEKIRHSYAVVLTSLGDISPNMIFDAIRVGTPFILTRETGIADRVKDIAIFVDPENKQDIAEKILWMADPKNREAQAKKIALFSFVHSWTNIADEIVAIWKKI